MGYVSFREGISFAHLPYPRHPGPPKKVRGSVSGRGAPKNIPNPNTVKTSGIGIWMSRDTPKRVRETKTLEVQVDYFLNGFSVKTIVLVGIYNQQFKGTILFMVFDFQGKGNLPFSNPPENPSNKNHHDDFVGTILRSERVVGVCRDAPGRKRNVPIRWGS